MKLLSKCPPTKAIHTVSAFYADTPVTYWINKRQCTKAAHEAALRALSSLQPKAPNTRPFQRLRGVRGRKDALLKRRVYTPCEHDWEYQEDDIGDPSVIDGTYTECYLVCISCGAQKAASYEDRPDYDYFYDDYEERW